MFTEIYELVLLRWWHKYDACVFIQLSKKQSLSQASCQKACPGGTTRTWTAKPPTPTPLPTPFPPNPYSPPPNHWKNTDALVWCSSVPGDSVWTLIPKLLLASSQDSAHTSRIIHVLLANNFRESCFKALGPTKVLAATKRMDVKAWVHKMTLIDFS